jgi:hypothetical protein
MIILTFVGFRLWWSNVRVLVGFRPTVYDLYLTLLYSWQLQYRYWTLFLRCQFDSLKLESARFPTSCTSMLFGWFVLLCTMSLMFVVTVCCGGVFYAQCFDGVYSWEWNSGIWLECMWCSRQMNGLLAEVQVSFLLMSSLVSWDTCAFTGGNLS